MEKYQHLDEIFLCLMWEDLGRSLYTVISLPSEWRSHTNNVKSAIFAKTGKTNVAVKWRIMAIQPKWGSDLGSLPGFTFMPCLKEIY